MRMRGGGLTSFELTTPDGETRRFSTCGRFAMTLRALIAAGPAGVTSLSLAQSWAIRTSHYIYRLRRDHGLLIETQMEEHGGPYSGNHARYILRDRVRVLGEDHSAAAVSTAPAASTLDQGAAA